MPSAEIVELPAKPELFKLLDVKDYHAKPERMLLLHLEAYDWNCPQHILPRHTEEEIETALATATCVYQKLEQEIKDLKSM